MEAEARPLVSLPDKSSFRPEFYSRQASRILPTDRIAFSRQLELLEAWAMSGVTATNTETIGRRVGLNPSTVSLANPFFVSIGLLDRAVRAFLPSAHLLEFAKNGDAAKLAPPLGRSWFARVLLPALPLAESASIQLLAKAADVRPDHNRQGQLSMLLDYLEASGIIDRDAGEVRAGNARDQRGSGSTNDGIDRPECVTVSTTFSHGERVLKFDADFPIELSTWQAGLARYFDLVVDGVARVFQGQDARPQSRESTPPRNPRKAREAMQPQTPAVSRERDLWLFKDDGVLLLGLCPRTFDRYVNDGSIRRKSGPGRRLMYNRDDIERIVWMRGQVLPLTVKRNGPTGEILAKEVPKGPFRGRTIRREPPPA